MNAPVYARHMHKIGQQQRKLGQPSNTELPLRSNSSPLTILLAPLLFLTIAVALHHT